MSETRGKNGPSPEKQRWVKRVLGIGVDVAQGGPGATPGTRQVAAWHAARADFEAAVESVSARIEDLRAAVSDYGRHADDEDLLDLAQHSEFGINGFTGNTFVRLRAALLDASGANLVGLRAVMPKVVRSAEAVEAALQGSEQVKVADDNPFGVRVGILDTLVPTLDRLKLACSDLITA